MSNVNCQVEQLTQEVIEAARDGKWDLVIDLYDRRLSQVPLQYISPALMHSLVKLDKWLVARVREAQAALQQHIFDIQDQRRKLEILKRQWGISPTIESRHLMTM